MHRIYEKSDCFGSWYGMAIYNIDMLEEYGKELQVPEILITDEKKEEMANDNMLGIDSKSKDNEID